jgi:hypothetical protein
MLFLFFWRRVGLSDVLLMNTAMKLLTNCVNFQEERCAVTDVVSSG